MTPPQTFDDRNFPVTEPESFKLIDCGINYYTLEFDSALTGYEDLFSFDFESLTITMTAPTTSLPVERIHGNLKLRVELDYWPEIFSVFSFPVILTDDSCQEDKPRFARLATTAKIFTPKQEWDVGFPGTHKDGVFERTSKS